MEQSQVVVAGSPNIKGDLTSCKIDNQLLSTQKDSAWSVRQVDTYISYDVCNKQILAKYSVPNFTDFSVSAFILLIIAIPSFLFWKMMNDF